MADRYLLESGSPDGYLLEDGSGVLILELSAVAPVQPQLGVQPQTQRRTFVPAVVLGANLLLTTLSPVTSPVPRAPTYQEGSLRPAVSVVNYPNLTTSTLSAVVATPFFTQQISSAPQVKYNIRDTSTGIPKSLFNDAQLPVGSDQVYTQPDRRRPVTDTSKGVPKTLYSDAQLPFGIVTPSILSVKNQKQLILQSDYRDWVSFYQAATTYVLSPSGTITFSGNVFFAHSKKYLPTGGIDFSGVATVQNINTIEPAGTITFSGSAPITFNPAAAGPPTTRLPMTGAGIT